MGRRRRHLPGLDGLRGLACLSVIVLHVWMYTGANDAGTNVTLDRAIGELRVAVTAFFVLSAFLLARPWVAAAREARARPRTAPFLAGRAARIWPGYWVALAGAWALTAATGSGRAAPAGDLPLYAALGQFQFDDSRRQLVPQAWTLAVEVSFYAALPLLGWGIVRLARRRGAGPATGLVAGAMAATGLTYCLLAEVLDWPPTVTTSAPTHLATLACGVAAAGLPAPRRSVQRIALLLAGCALVVANGRWHAYGTGIEGHVVRDVPAALGFALVVLALAHGRAGPLDWAPVRFLGTVSYGAYLWHLPVIFALTARDALPDDPAVAIATVAATSFALGSVSWFAVERPVIRAVGRTLRRRAAVGPATATA